MLLEKFQDLSKFSHTNITIINYLLQNINDIDKITISELARETYTSNPTIIRFCHRLGFNGFKDFKIQLIKEINSQYEKINIINPNIPFEPADTLATISHNLSELIQISINKTYLSLNIEMLKKAIKMILDAKRLFIFGKGDSYIRAQSFKNRMMKINKYIILADENHEGSYNVRNISSEDCALFLTYSATHYDYNSFTNILKASRAPTIIITANPDALFAKICDVVITIPQDESFDSKIACFTSQIAFEYILDIIYSAIFVTNYHSNYDEKKLKEKYVNKIISGEL